MIKRLRLKFRGLTHRELTLHYNAIFDTLIGIVLLMFPIVSNGAPEQWQVSLVVGLSPLWGIAFILAGVLAFVSNLSGNEKVGRFGLSMTAGLSVGRGVAFFFAAFAVWPALAAILISSGLVWIKQGLLIFSASKKEESRSKIKES